MKVKVENDSVAVNIVKEIVENSSMVAANDSDSSSDSTKNVVDNKVKA